MCDLQFFNQRFRVSYRRLILHLRPLGLHIGIEFHLVRGDDQKDFVFIEVGAGSSPRKEREPERRRDGEYKNHPHFPVLSIRTHYFRAGLL